MTSQSFSFRYPESAPSEDPAAALREALREGTLDRASTARTLAAEAAECLRVWWRARAESRPVDELAAAAGAGLEPWRGVHGWRGPCERLCATLDELFASFSAQELSAAVDEELSAWIAPGGRMPDRRAVGRAAAAGVSRGETVLTHGFSETVALACEEAALLDRPPEVVLGDGGSDYAGQRMARRLAEAGLRVRLVHDAALSACVGGADRVWAGTESIAPGGFVARVGTRALLEEAGRQEVPTAVLATSDKLAPAGESPLPRWCDCEPWLLCPDAPPGVEVHRQLYERVPPALAGSWFTEVGLERPAELFVRGAPGRPTPTGVAHAAPPLP
ncbi:MAG: hypothetical protein QF903_10940 [Planctomycetota bacterium]|jgi:hypothetical protein|nr:hypothetical protein [Planctomycetota bacterium]MDP6762676.1 hypothetical protein [Planctomycetota bacterium]MDP6989985.1 hypothetical protein [Planctomycetota bacterium]